MGNGIISSFWFSLPIFDVARQAEWLMRSPIVNQYFNCVPIKLPFIADDNKTYVRDGTVQQSILCMN